jgi:hypothetical protein
MVKILVCGGRDYGHVVRTKPTMAEEPPAVHARFEEYRHIYDFLNELINNISAEFKLDDNWLPTDVTIIHGGATGVDSVAGEFANVNFCMERCFTPDWKQYGSSAGPIRNAKMLEEGEPDLVVAFPGGKGTANMVNLAKKAGVKVIEVGTKGSSVRFPELRTEKYRKVFVERMSVAPAAQPSYKTKIFLECIDEESQWLKSIETMDQEYNEIIGAQQAMDDINGKKSA